MGPGDNKHRPAGPLPPKKKLGFGRVCSAFSGLVHGTPTVRLSRDTPEKSGLSTVLHATLHARVLASRVAWPKEVETCCLPLTGFPNSRKWLKSRNPAVRVACSTACNTQPVGHTSHRAEARKPWRHFCTVASHGRLLRFCSWAGSSTRLSVRKVLNFEWFDGKTHEWAKS